MSYVEDNLMPNEKVLFSARIHPAIFLPAIISFLASAAILIISINIGRQNNSGASAIAGLVLCLAGFFFIYTLILGFQALIVMLTTEFAVTNRRVIAKTGFIRRHTLEMLLNKIESVAVHQGILARMLNFGSVTVTGTGGTRESFRAIAEPIKVRSKINQIIEQSTQGFSQQQGTLNKVAGG
jgi:uncharacterized membrane protein YdbT with pleckstrin-like domain